MKTRLTPDRLRELLAYNPSTGAFTWRTRRNQHVAAGDSAGRLHANGYIYISVDGREYLAHRLAWLHATGQWPREQIDHIDGDRASNVLANLREVSNAVNQQNQRRARRDNKSSGLLGVKRNRKRWKASIQIDGKQRVIGTFDTPEQAHAAYIEEKRRVHPGGTL
jgi:hypothetical protein